MLLSTGERISAALCAMAIEDLGHRAVSLTGSQAGIVTDTVHTKAKIVDIRPEAHRGGAGRGPDRAGGRLPGRLHRLRRHHPRPRRLGHDRRRAGRAHWAATARSTPTSRACSRPTPGSCPRPASCPASRRSRCSRWPAPGARVLQLRSVEFARNHGVPIHVRSTFSDADGTWIREDATMEDAIISGITHTVDEAYVTLTDVPDKPGTAAAHLQRRRRRPHQRRHDHPERGHPRRRRHHLLDPGATTCR